MTRTSILVPACLLVLGAGCTTVESMCTDDARSSITLDVVDESGNAIADATATYSVDGGDLQDCTGAGDGSLACGWEEDGEFVVTVDAEGFAADSFTQSVGSDECHVLTEVVEFTLFALDCTAQEVPSVEVTVTDGQGADVTSGDVMWNMAAEDDLPEPCTHQGGNVWTCAEEVEGELAIEISNAGPYEPYRELVTVGADECHVITEALAAVLQYLPD